MKWIKATHAVLALMLMETCFVQFANAQGITQLKELAKTSPTAEDAIKWVKDNIYYRNVDKFDEAPPLDKVLSDGYGDCKMLAGVTAELLREMNIENWIVTIWKEDAYHVINVFRTEPRVFRVVDNAKLLPQSFKSWHGISDFYNVPHFIKKQTSYETFQKWFNNSIISQKTGRKT